MIERLSQLVTFWPRNFGIGPDASGLEFGISVLEFKICAFVAKKATSRS
jgi:hypothetical protein